MPIQFARRYGRLAALPALTLAVALAGSPPAGAAADAGAGSDTETVPAVWNLQEIDFSYYGFTTLYQCDALEHKVERILDVVGAHDSTRVRVTGCDFNRPSRSAFVHITTAAPVPATPENLQRTAAEESREKLLDRLGVKRKFDPDEQFPAQWKTVSLAQDRSLRLEPGDCELMQHMRDRVFPKIGVEVVANEVRCTPGDVPLTTPRLDVRALVKAPSPDEPPQATKSQQ